MHYWSGYINNDLAKEPRIKSVLERVVLGDSHCEGKYGPHKKAHISAAWLSYSDRVLLVTKMVEGKRYLLALEEICNHRYDKSPYLNNASAFKAWMAKIQTTEDEIIKVEDIEQFIDNRKDLFLSPPLTPAHHYGSIFILPSKTQQEALTGLYPTIIIGGGGSGKTCVASMLIEQKVAEFAASPKKNHSILYVVDSEKLATHMQFVWDTANPEPPPNITVDILTYDKLYEKHCAQSEQDFLPTVRKETFLSWITTTHKQFLQELNKNSEKIYTPTSLYHEFQVISSLNEISLEHYSALGTFQSRIRAEKRAIVFSIYTRYLDYLADIRSTDLSLHRLKATQPSYQMVIVDEAQAFKVQLHFLYSLTEKNPLCGRKPIYLCGDPNQSLEGISHLFSIPGESYCINLGANSFRTPQVITEIGHNIRLISGTILGGSLFKVANPLSISSEGNHDKGSVEWYSPKEKEKYDVFVKTPNTIIIIPNEMYREAAQLLFKGNFNICTAKQIRGLQALQVILYNFFANNPIAIQINAILEHNGLSEKETYNLPKNKQVALDNEDLMIFLNTLYIACTRAMSRLIFVDEKPKKVKYLVDTILGKTMQQLTEKKQESMNEKTSLSSSPIRGEIIPHELQHRWIVQAAKWIINEQPQFAKPILEQYKLSACIEIFQYEAKKPHFIDALENNCHAIMEGLLSTAKKKEAMGKSLKSARVTYNKFYPNLDTTQMNISWDALFYPILALFDKKNIQESLQELKNNLQQEKDNALLMFWFFYVRVNQRCLVEQIIGEHNIYDELLQWKPFNLLVKQVDESVMELLIQNPQKEIIHLLALSSLGRKMLLKKFKKIESKDLLYQANHLSALTLMLIHEDSSDLKKLKITELTSDFLFQQGSPSLFDALIQSKRIDVLQWVLEQTNLYHHIPFAALRKNEKLLVKNPYGRDILKQYFDKNESTLSGIPEFEIIASENIDDIKNFMNTSSELSLFILLYLQEKRDNLLEKILNNPTLKETFLNWGAKMNIFSSYNWHDSKIKLEPELFYLLAFSKEGGEFVVNNLGKIPIKELGWVNPYEGKYKNTSILYWLIKNRHIKSLAAFLDAIAWSMPNILEYLLDAFFANINDEENTSAFYLLTTYGEAASPFLIHFIQYTVKNKEQFFTREVLFSKKSPSAWANLVHFTDRTIDGILKHHSSLKVSLRMNDFRFEEAFGMDGEIHKIRGLMALTAPTSWTGTRLFLDLLENENFISSIVESDLYTQGEGNITAFYYLSSTEQGIKCLKKIAAYNPTLLINCPHEILNANVFYDGHYLRTPLELLGHFIEGKEILSLIQQPQNKPLLSENNASFFANTNVSITDENPQVTIDKNNPL